MPAEQLKIRLKPGDRVFHFQIVRSIGRGGMGEVFLARDMSLGRKVALKVLLPEVLQRHSSRERFLFEARATAQFSHPNIVTIYSVGEYRGHPYVALEYLEGQTLRQRLAERPSAKESARIALAIAEALTEAHSRKILHRDLKPENVLIGRDGRPRVVDFGLAKILQSAEPEVRTPRDTEREEDDENSMQDQGFALGDTIQEDHKNTPGNWRRRIAGTPPYMAPEQWLLVEQTQAIDIWALGVMLYELLRGELPYSQRDLAKLRHSITSRDPTPALPASREAPQELCDLVARCVSKSPEERPAAAEVVTELRELLSTSGARPSRDVSPFRGLLPFDERHGDLFFGRESEVGAFVERLREVPVLPVVGPSGGGKSSFVSAGIVPRLREQGPWQVLSIRPGNKPFEALAMRLVRGETHRDPFSTGTSSKDSEGSRSSPSGEEGQEQGLGPEKRDELADELRSSPSLFSLLLTQRAEREDARVLLFVDQLEELYTLVPDEEERRAFMEAVCGAADDPLGPVRVIFTLRDDFLGKVAETPTSRRALESITVLRSPGVESLREIITKPLERVGFAYESRELVNEMLRSVGGEAACLPLLQFACSRLWEQRDRRRRLLTRSAYEAMGGVEGALAHQADEVLAALTPAQGSVARQIFLRLVTPEGTRRTTSRTALLEGLGPEGEAVLRRLTKARAVIARRARAGLEDSASLELVHESLIKNWGQLSQWIEESREEVTFLAEVDQVAELWERRGRRDEEVWRGDALTEAHFRAARCQSLPSRVRAFLEAGERREQRRGRRRRFILGAVLITLGLVAFTLGLAATVAMRQREIASQERVRAEQGRAEALREGARAALGRGNVLEARAKLRGALEASDSTLARALWLSLRDDPLVWRKVIGTGEVYSVAFSPDGTRIAAACQDQVVRLLDVRSMAVKRLRGHRDQVLAVDFSPDGQSLASGSWSGEVRIWSRNGRMLGSLEGHESGVCAIAFGPRGNLLATAGMDRTIRLWDLDEGSELALLRGHEANIWGLGFDPQARWLASSAQDGTVRVWDVARRTVERVLTGHDAAVWQVRFSPDGSLLASSSDDRTVRLWELGGEGTQKTLRGHGGGVAGLAFSPDGETLATGSYDTTVRLWDVRSGRERRALEGHTGLVRTLDFGPRGELVVSGSQDGTLRLWNLSKGADEGGTGGHEEPVVALRFHPQGEQLVSGSRDGTIRVWDVETGRCLRVQRGHEGVVRSLAYTSDGSELASGGTDTTIRLWDSATGAALGVLRGPTASVFSLAFFPAGNRLAVGSMEDVARILDRDLGGRAVELRGHEGRAPQLALSRDGRILATGGRDRTIRLWDAATGSPLEVLRGHASAIRGLDFSPDGALVASGSSDGTARVWDVTSGVEQHALSHGGRVYQVHFHPDGERLATACADDNAYVWDLKRTSSIHLRGHRGEVNVARFSTDGALIATASDDGTVRLWEAETGRPRWRAPLLSKQTLELATHEGWVFLGPVKSTRPETTRWRRAVEEQARRAAEHRGQLLCLATHQEELQLWDMVEDRLLDSAAVPGLGEVRALAEGCLFIAEGELKSIRAGQEPRSLAEGVQIRAFSWSPANERVLAATKTQALVLNLEGERLAEHQIDQGVTAIAWLWDAIVLGYEDGDLDILTPTGEERDGELSFEETPLSPVVSLIEGPQGTLIAGFANGELGIWSMENGSRLLSERLHGPVIHLVLSDRQLYAVTELGQHRSIDLSVFERDYCELLGEVWAEVPVAWENARPVPREAPADHQCRE